MFSNALKFSLTCLLVSQSFYAQEAETTTIPLKHALTWTFVVERSAPEITQDWAQLVAHYIGAAKALYKDSELPKDLKNIDSLVQKLQQEKDFSLTFDLYSQKEAQTFIGEKFATLLKTRSAEKDGIHGNLYIQLNEEQLDKTSMLAWTLEIGLEETYSEENLASLKNDLAALSNELNNGTLENTSVNYGSLLHGIVDCSRNGALYTCTATLTLHA